MQALFGRYISECCSDSIQCPSQTASTISTSLWPAYEDLFDQAEEHTLDMLFAKWNDLNNSEDVAFQSVRYYTVSDTGCNSYLVI